MVTLEQIQGLQPNRLADILYNVPGVSLQERGDDPSTVINIRGLQDFGRVAVVVDGARQNYQRTGHNANGSFFLDPELIGGIDIVRGPTANIYGSGAIGGVVSFRTKDIERRRAPGRALGRRPMTVSRRHQLWLAASVRSSAAFTSIPNRRCVCRRCGLPHAGNYKDGNGFEIGNTGNRLTAGIAKLTVRPADGHEVKLGTIFQDDLYSVGQQPRRAGDPNSTNANGTTT